MLAPDSVVRIAPGVVSAPVDGETTVLDPATGLYFGLEDVAARIWALLDQPVALRAVIARLHAEYDVPLDACEADVIGFTDELVRRGLAVVVPAGAP